MTMEIMKSMSSTSSDISLPDVYFTPSALIRALQANGEAVANPAPHAAFDFVIGNPPFAAAARASA